MTGVRLDRDAPEWAIGIADDLYAGIAPGEALRNAACALHYEAGRAALRGLRHRLRFDSLRRLGGVFLFAEDRATDEACRAADEFERSAHLHATARGVLRLRGMVVMGRLI